MCERRHFPKTGPTKTHDVANTRGVRKTLPEDRSGEDTWRRETLPEDRSRQDTLCREDTCAQACSPGMCWTMCEGVAFT